MDLKANSIKPQLKTRKSRPDAPLYKPPAMRNSAREKTKKIVNYKPITKTDEANAVDCNLSDDISLSYFNNVLNLQKDPNDIPEISENVNTSSHDNHKENKTINDSTKYNFVLVKEENSKRITENYNKLTDNEENKEIHIEKNGLLNKTCDKIEEKFISVNNLECSNSLNECKMPNAIDAISDVVDISSKNKPINGTKDLKNNENECFIDETDKEENLDIDNWEDLFDENGQIERDLMPQIVKSTNVINIVQEKDDEDDSDDVSHTKIIKGLENLSHVIEFYEFPTEFQTLDLITILGTHINDACNIKWVDTNHALGVFASENIARKVLQIQHPLIKVRTLNEASKQSIDKAKRNLSSLLPYIARPQTCPQIARRMVTGALGLRLKSSKEDREKERQILKEAREKRKLTLKQEDDAWEGCIKSSK